MVIRKCVQFCTDRQTIDCNVTGCIVIACWIINSTDTNIYGDEKMCTDFADSQNKVRKVKDCMVIAYWTIISACKNWYGDKELCTFFTDRQIIDSNVTGCKVIN
jgi:hypothetical protein